MIAIWECSVGAQSEQYKKLTTGNHNLEVETAEWLEIVQSYSKLCMA